MQSFFALIDQLNACSGADRAQAAAALWSRFGIDYGRFLMVPGKDCYGDPINTACGVLYS